MAEPCFLCIDRLATERTGEDHFSVGFGDSGFVVTLDGKSVENYAIEARAGDEGWVVLTVTLESRPGLVRCWADSRRKPHPYTVLRRGRVTVAAPPRPLLELVRDG